MPTPKPKKKMADGGLVAGTAISSDRGDQYDYEAEDALRTLTRAEEIEANADLMKRVRALAQSKLKAMQAVIDESDDGDGADAEGASDKD